MSSTLNPALSKLDLALSEFFKARWTTEPSVDAPLQPTDLDLVASTPSSLGKQASFALARFLRAGAPWRDLPEEFGKSNSVFKRFRRWAKKGVWTAFRRAGRKS